MFHSRCKPGDSKEILIPWLTKLDKEAVKTVSALLKDDQIWAKAGFEVAFGQTIVGEDKPLSVSKTTAKSYYW